MFIFNPPIYFIFIVIIPMTRTQIRQLIMRTDFEIWQTYVRISQLFFSSSSRRIIIMMNLMKIDKLNMMMAWGSFQWI